MKHVLLLVLTLLPIKNFAGDLSIIDVHRSIAMSEDEVAVRDFYIASNDNIKLKSGQVVKVFRTISPRDSAGRANYGEFKMPVADLKILTVSGKIAVARESKIYELSTRPYLEVPGPMVGDSIE